jgi:adenylate cyclase
VFLSSAGFLLLHALATPGIVLGPGNAGFAIATAVGLLLRPASPPSPASS